MPTFRSTLLVLLAVGIPLLNGCSSLQKREPLQAFMVGAEPLQGEGLEVRMLIKLRIQNPNDAPVEFNGVFVEMDVQGKPFATGVSGDSGSVPRFGETIVSLPVSISAFRIARQAIGIATNEYQGKLTYALSGKLSGSTFRSVHFKSTGEFTLPADIYESGK
jgi:LEA14-like dessication related protein